MGQQMTQFNAFWSPFEENEHDQILMEFGNIEVSIVKRKFTASPWFEGSWHNKGKSNWADPVIMENMQDLFEFMNKLSKEGVINKKVLDI